MDPEEPSQARLLSLLAVLLGALDIAVLAVCWAFARPPYNVAAPKALAVGVLFYAASFVLNRRSHGRVALGVLVAGELFVCTLTNVLSGEHDALAMLNFAVWFVLPVLTTAALSTHRAVVVVGGISLAIFVGVSCALGAFTANVALSPLLYLITITTLGAVVTRHHLRLDAIHRDRLEQRVEERTRALLATEKMAVLGRLTADVAHDLASPLAAILASASEVRSTVEDLQEAIHDRATPISSHHAKAEQIAEAAEILSSAAERAADFVRSIKSQTRIEAAGRAKDIFDAVEIVEGSLSLLSYAARTSHVKLAVVAPVRPLTVEGAPGRLAQVVTNLVQNAIDATGDRGGGEVEVEVILAEPGLLRVAVRDEGGGIPDDLRERIFEPLFTTKPFGRGTGLGLAIVQESVTALGGTVRVDTKVGKGSTFTVEVPTASASNAA